MSALIVEDDLDQARYLQLVLERQGWTVVTTSTCRGALEALDECAFDLVIADLGLPDGDGCDVLDAARQATTHTPALLVASVFDDEATLARALDAGAMGYVLKDGAEQCILAAVEAVLHGHGYLSPRAAGLVLRERRANAREAQRVVEHLTRREQELLIALARGLTYRECAALMEVTLGTIQSHVKNLYGKLDVGSKAEASALAARAGLVQ